MSYSIQKNISKNFLNVKLQIKMLKTNNKAKYRKQNEENKRQNLSRKNKSVQIEIN